MKKVLFVITKSNWGGAQRYVYDLATHLPKEKFDPVVTLGGSEALKTRLEEAGIRTISIPSLERDVGFVKELQSLKNLWSILHQEHPDILHLNSSKAGGLGSVVAAYFRFYLKCQRLFGVFVLKNKKAAADTNHYSLITIFTVHGWAFNEDRHFAVRFVIRLLQWITVWFCDYVIIISNRDFRQALHLPLVNRKKFVLIPLGIPQNSISFLTKHAARKALAEAIKIPARNLIIVIGTIAELTKNKGLEYFIEAIAKLSHFPVDQSNKTKADNRQLQTKNYSPEREHSELDVKLKTIIIGEGEERKKLEILIQRYGLQEIVFLAGFIPDAAQYLKAFDLFVLSSLKEGLPYTIIEAMHAGVPVIGSRVGGIPDLIEQEGTGIIVPPKNPQALSDAIKRLLDDEALRKKFGKQSQKRAQERFSFETMLSATIRLYNEV